MQTPDNAIQIHEASGTFIRNRTVVAHENTFVQGLSEAVIYALSGSVVIAYADAVVHAAAGSKVLAYEGAVVHAEEGAEVFTTSDDNVSELLQSVLS